MNSGSAGTYNEGGIVIESGSAFAGIPGTGTAFYFDHNDNRWSLKNSLNSTNTAQTDPDAFMAAVVTNNTDVKYQKAGNIRIEGEDIFIYS